MEQLLSAMVGKLDPVYIFVLIVLYGVWKFVNKGLNLFSEHGTKLTDGINSLSSDIKGIRNDLSVAVSEIQSHEKTLEQHDHRIGKLEEPSEGASR